VDSGRKTNEKDKMRGIYDGKMALSVRPHLHTTYHFKAQELKLANDSP